MDTDLLYQNGTFSLAWLAGSGLLSQKAKRQKYRQDLLNCDLESLCKELVKYVPDPGREDAGTPSGRKLGLKKVAILMDGFSFILEYQILGLRDELYSLLTEYKKKRSLPKDALDFNAELSVYEQQVQKKDKKVPKRTASTRDTGPQIVDLATGIKLPKIVEGDDAFTEVQLESSFESSVQAPAASAVAGPSRAHTIRETDLPEERPATQSNGFYDGSEAPGPELDELIGVFEGILNQSRQTSPTRHDETLGGGALNDPESPRVLPETQQRKIPRVVLRPAESTPPRDRALSETPSSVLGEAVPSPRRSRSSKKLKFQDSTIPKILLDGTSIYVSNGYQLTEEDRELLQAIGREKQADPTAAKDFKGFKAIEFAGRKVPGKGLGKFVLDLQDKFGGGDGRRGRRTSSVPPQRPPSAMRENDEEDVRAPTSSRVGGPDHLATGAHHTGSGLGGSAIDPLVSGFPIPPSLPASPNPPQATANIGMDEVVAGATDNFGMDDIGAGTGGLPFGFGSQSPSPPLPQPTREGPVLFKDLAPHGITPRDEAVRLFHELLTRQAKGEILMVQHEAWGDIEIHYLK